MCIPSTNNENGTATEATRKTDNEIRADGARALSEALKVNTTLTTLNLSCTDQQQTTAMKRQQQQQAKQATRSAQREHEH